MADKISKPGLLALIASGGAIGAGLRYLMILSSPFTVEAVVWVILFENIIGAFLLGWISGLIISKKLAEWPWLPFLGTGVLGSFTTFSTMILDFQYLAAQSYIIAATYILISLSGGIIAALTGLYFGRGKKV